MNDKIIELEIWKKEKQDKSGLFLTKTRGKSYCTLYYCKDGNIILAFKLDFRKKLLLFLQNDVAIDWLNVWKIDELTAYSLLKELLDQKLSADLKLSAKEAAIYDKATHALLYHTKDLKRLSLKSKSADETLDMLKNVLLYSDYGLLYELAGEMVCSSEMTKHIFIHDCRENNKSRHILEDTLKFTKLSEEINEFDEQVLAGCASWEYYENQKRCRLVMYFELYLVNDGYTLHRYLPLDHHRMYYDDEYSFKYYLQKYSVPDGRWLAGALMNDENILLIGEKNFYQLYVFVRDKCNSAAKIIVKEKEIIVFADERAKLDSFVQYLSDKLISDMDDLLITTREMTALEMMKVLLDKE